MLLGLGSRTSSLAVLSRIGLKMVAMALRLWAQSVSMLALPSIRRVSEFPATLTRLMENADTFSAIFV